MVQVLDSQIGLSENPSTLMPGFLKSGLIESGIDITDDAAIEDLSTAQLARGLASLMPYETEDGRRRISVYFAADPDSRMECKRGNTVYQIEIDYFDEHGCRFATTLYFLNEQTGAVSRKLVCPNDIDNVDFPHHRALEEHITQTYGDGFFEFDCYDEHLRQELLDAVPCLQGRESRGPSDFQQERLLALLVYMRSYMQTRIGDSDRLLFAGYPLNATYRGAPCYLQFQGGDLPTLYYRLRSDRDGHVNGWRLVETGGRQTTDTPEVFWQMSDAADYLLVGDVIGRQNAMVA